MKDINSGTIPIFKELSELSPEASTLKVPLLEQEKGNQAVRTFHIHLQRTKRLESEGADLELNVENYTDYLITYPYSTHPFYTVDESVEMDFNGSSAFKGQEADIYLVDMRGTGLKSMKPSRLSKKRTLPAPRIFLMIPSNLTHRLET